MLSVIAVGATLALVHAETSADCDRLHRDAPGGLACQVPRHFGNFLRLDKPSKRAARDGTLRKRRDIHPTLLRELPYSAGLIVHPERVAPGQIALHVIPYRPTSSARVRVKPITPCLAAAYAPSFGIPMSPPTEAILIMRPL